MMNSRIAWPSCVGARRPVREKLRTTCALLLAGSLFCSRGAWASDGKYVEIEVRICGLRGASSEEIDMLAPDPVMVYLPAESQITWGGLADELAGLLTEKNEAWPLPEPARNLDLVLGEGERLGFQAKGRSWEVDRSEEEPSYEEEASTRLAYYFEADRLVELPKGTAWVLSPTHDRLEKVMIGCGDYVRVCLQVNPSEPHKLAARQYLIYVHKDNPIDFVLPKLLEDLGYRPAAGSQGKDYYTQEQFRFFAWPNTMEGDPLGLEITGEFDAGHDVSSYRGDPLSWQAICGKGAENSLGLTAKDYTTQIGWFSSCLYNYWGWTYVMDKEGKLTSYRGSWSTLIITALLALGMLAGGLFYQGLLGAEATAELEEEVREEKSQDDDEKSDDGQGQGAQPARPGLGG